MTLRSIKLSILPVAGLVAILGTLASFSGAAQGRVALMGHVLRQIQDAVKLERAPADESVQLSLVVRLDQNLLDETLDQLYGRNAPVQKHYLSSSEFAQKFGLADKRAQLKNFALANGLTVDAADNQPESMVVKVSGGASAVEKAFSIRLNHYRGPYGQVFRANETEPMIPAALESHLGAILGFSNITGVAHPHFMKSTVNFKPGSLPRVASGASFPSTFTGSLGPFLVPQDIRSVYGLTQVALNGSGQEIALFELDGFNPADVTAFETIFNLPLVNATFIGVDGTTNLCGGQSCSGPTPSEGQVEVSLDIDMVLALASAISHIYVYDGPNTDQGILDTYNKIATDNISKVVSTSWGLDEADSNVNPSFIPSESQIFQRMATQGQSVFAASGDCGAYDTRDFNTGACITTNGFHVDDPASQPYVTGVGGTTLTGNLSSFTETTWNEFSISAGAGGGGVSTILPIPSYQIGVAGTASQQFRNVPDVALNADPVSGYIICVANTFPAIGGTSAAAPLWAALTVLINQQRAAAGKGGLGFANPTLYQLGTSTSAATVFNDIATGNNAVSGHFNAGPGYDNATGWGSFKGSSMIDAASQALSLTILNSLASVYAFPNPWDTRKATRRQVTVTNLPDGATVKIFTLSGFWVKTLPLASGGSAVWDLTNDSGNSVASGLYFYLVTTPTNSAKGEIAIIK